MTDPAATPAVRRVVHPVITTADLDAALRFYRDLLGLEVLVDVVHDPEPLGRLSGYDRPDARAVVLAAPDGTEIELVEFRRPRGRARNQRSWPDAGINSVTFAVAGLDELLARATAAGHRLLGEVVTYALGAGQPVRVVYCVGPDEVVLTFIEPVATAGDGERPGRASGHP
jgi:catechol 2,3-dioxygenase-like lactoylglutathione lyase family enzyme